MKELTGSAKIADEAIDSAARSIERGIGTRATLFAWLDLAYAAMRILANISDTLDKLNENARRMDR